MAAISPIRSLAPIAGILTAVCLAAWLRLLLTPWQSGDYGGALVPWAEFILKHGGLPAFRHNFSNYTPAYLYWLWFAVTGLAWLPRVIAIKLLAMVTDFALAACVAGIVRLSHPRGPRPILAAIAVLFTPTVVLNSAYWGQCDSIYTFWALACLYALASGRQTVALVCFGLGFSFKLQALFLGPLLLVLLLSRHLDWRRLWLVPAVYLLSVTPAWIAGRPLPELLLIYLGQANYYRVLSNNAPNLYQWLSNDQYDQIVPIGFAGALAAIALYTWLALRDRDPITPRRLLELAMVSAVLVPYCLPKMHDRYFFMADVLTIAFAFCVPRYWWVALVVQGASLASYSNYIFWSTELDFSSLVRNVSIPLGQTLIFLLLYLSPLGKRFAARTRE